MWDIRSTKAEIQLSLKRLPDPSLSSVAGWRREGCPVKTCSTGSNAHGWTGGQQRPGSSFKVMAYSITLMATFPL